MHGEINWEIIFLETSSSEKCRPIALGCVHMLLRIWKALMASIDVKKISHVFSRT